MSTVGPSTGSWPLSPIILRKPSIQVSFTVPFFFGWVNEVALRLGSLARSRTHMLYKRLISFLSIISYYFGTGFAREHTGLVPSFNSKSTGFVSQVPLDFYRTNFHIYLTRSHPVPLLVPLLVSEPYSHKYNPKFYHSKHNILTITTFRKDVPIFRLKFH